MVHLNTTSRIATITKPVENLGHWNYNIFGDTSYKAINRLKLPDDFWFLIPAIIFTVAFKFCQLPHLIVIDLQN